jgi:hypothetical protein
MEAERGDGGREREIGKGETGEWDRGKEWKYSRGEGEA